MGYQYTTRDGKRVEVHVAAAFDKFASAFKNKFGLTLHVTDGTRTRAEQAALFKIYQNGGTLAAEPGYSNHEEDGPIGPVALDLHDSGADAGISVAGSARANWARSNAASYGFKPAGYSFKQVEPWHFEFTGKIGGAVADAKSDTQVVKDEQSWVNTHAGEKLSVDGIVGPATVAAFKRYQGFLKKNYGYTGAVDGVWGPGTQAAHAKYVTWTHNKPAASSPDVLKKGSQSAKVKALQSELNRIFPSYSKLATDGNFGPATESVIRTFQGRVGITADGIVGSATTAKLKTYGAKF